MKDKKIINSWRQQEATTMKTNEGLSHGDILQKQHQEIQVHEEIKKNFFEDNSHLSIFSFFFSFSPFDLVMWTNISKTIKSYKKQRSHHTKEEATWSMKRTFKKTSM